MTIPRALVIGAARLRGGDDLPRHAVVGGNGDARPDPHASDGDGQNHQQHNDRQQANSAAVRHEVIVPDPRSEWQ